jgi:hypothetical protein
VDVAADVNFKGRKSSLFFHYQDQVVYQSIGAVFGLVVVQTDK